MPVTDVLTALGEALADRSRASVLVALMDGRARSAGELAAHAHVAPPTMSQHLARLRQAGFIDMATQGRHRYFRLANDQIGALLETIGTLDVAVPATPQRLSAAPEELRFARSCYNHLAGTLAVAIYQRLLEHRHVTRSDGAVRLTGSGRTLMTGLGATVAATRESRPALRPCLDWTERRDHLAGPVAASLFSALLERRWIAHGTRPRSIRLTQRGRRGLEDCLGPGLTAIPRPT